MGIWHQAGSSPFKGEAGRGMGLMPSGHQLPIPTLTPPLKGRE